MEDLKYSDELYGNIIKSYLDTASVKETAAQLKTTPVKVRKVLITEGLWSSKKSQEIQHYLNLGMSTSQIAEQLSTTEKAVQQYLPYTKGIYGSDHPSVAALNSADYRERIRVVQEKTIRQNLAIAVKNQWDERMETFGRKNIREEKNMAANNEIERYPGNLYLPEDADQTKFKALSHLEPVRLHLELVLCEESCSTNEKMSEYLRKETEDRSKVLREYGDVKYGDTISRDIIVPGNMPLWALNYVIQKCFGWQNSHLHCFELPTKQFERICEGESRKYIDLVGVAFRSPWMDEEEEFWTDDYIDGSFKTWLRKKYTGPYESRCHGEGIWQCKQDVRKMKDRYAYVSVEHSTGDTGYVFYDCPKAITKKEYDKLITQCPIKRIVKGVFDREEIKTKEVFTFDEIPLEAMRWMTENGSLNKLLERLSILEVFAIQNQGIEDGYHEGQKVPACFDEVMTEEVKNQVEKYRNMDQPHAQPHLKGLTEELIYNYDFGDNWKVRITASYGAADLVESGRVTQQELTEAVIRMQEAYRPVCIAKDGMMVLDDVGGIAGYTQFLKGINQKSRKKDECRNLCERNEEYGVYDDKEGSLAWAKSLGWSKRKVSSKNLL